MNKDFIEFAKEYLEEHKEDSESYEIFKEAIDLVYSKTQKQKIESEKISEEHKEYFTSDLHFFHDREFIYGPRGFSSEEQMREAYIKQWYSIVRKDDDIYVLGDFCAGSDMKKIRDLIISLPGKIHLIIGNHDTDAKVELYRTLPNIVEITYQTKIVRNKRTYYLTHHPLLVSNLESDPSKSAINLHGHLHEAKKCSGDRPFTINVSVDANDNKFVTIEDIEQIFKEEVNKCLSYVL